MRNEFSSWKPLVYSLMNPYCQVSSSVGTSLSLSTQKGAGWGWQHRAADLQRRVHMECGGSGGFTAILSRTGWKSYFSQCQSGVQQQQQWQKTPLKINVYNQIANLLIFHYVCGKNWNPSISQNLLFSM